MIFSKEFEDTGKEAEFDKKRRVTLGMAVPVPPEGVRFRVYANKLGQILLDPVKSVPAHEAWIYENPERIASIRRGIAQAEAGQLVSINLGSEGKKVGVRTKVHSRSRRTVQAPRKK